MRTPEKNDAAKRDTREVQSAFSKVNQTRLPKNVGDIFAKMERD